VKEAVAHTAVWTVRTRFAADRSRRLGMLRPAMDVAPASASFAPLLIIILLALMAIVAVLVLLRFLRMGRR
jgi:hypothetical protein